MLTNVDLTLRDVLPGSITAAVLLEATFQVLPQYVLLSKHNPVLQTLSGPAVLLVWLYVMANVIVLGAEVNWWRANRPVRAVASSAHASATCPRANCGCQAPGSNAQTSYRRWREQRGGRSARCEFSRFHSSPSSATVCVSPAGTKIGS